MKNRLTSPKVLATVEFVCALITVYLYRIWRNTEQTEIAMITSALAIGLAVMLIKNMPTVIRRLQQHLSEFTRIWIGAVLPSSLVFISTV